MKFLLILGVGILFMGFSLQRNINLPRGIRNNNPGNIRRNSIQWEGMQTAQNDDAFVQFISPEYGFRAMARLLRTYNQRGLNTVRTIISTYAPSTENHTANYIRFVSERLNVSPDTVLDVEAIMPDLIQAITIFENGTQYANHYSKSTIEGGILLA